MNVLEILKNQKQSSGIFTKPVSALHEFYLTGKIEAPENYIDWFDTIRHAGENDEVKIYINSCGGDLFTAIQFLRVLSETNATVIVSVEGACMSAATMIFISADSVEVTPHSMFMFHSHSGGSIGKSHEMYDQLIHERKWSNKLIESIYKDFLTEDEIMAVIDGKDIWMDADQVMARLEKRAEAKESQENSEENQD